MLNPKKLLIMPDQYQIRIKDLNSFEFYLIINEPQNLAQQFATPYMLSSFKYYEILEQLFFALLPRSSHPETLELLDISRVQVLTEQLLWHLSPTVSQGFKTSLRSKLSAELYCPQL